LIIDSEILAAAAVRRQSSDLMQIANFLFDHRPPAPYHKSNVFNPGPSDARRLGSPLEPALDRAPTDRCRPRLRLGG
jgi:hypothetical protein